MADTGTGSNSNVGTNNSVEDKLVSSISSAFDAIVKNNLSNTDKDKAIISDKFAEIAGKKFDKSDYKNIGTFNYAPKSLGSGDANYNVIPHGELLGEIISWRKKENSSSSGQGSDKILALFNNYFAIEEKNKNVVTLHGNRCGITTSDDIGLSKLYVGDIAYLFYYDRMGIFKMLSAVLDDYAYNGKYTLSVFGRESALLNELINRTRTGTSSTAKDRNSTYVRSLGWILPEGRSLGLQAEPNRQFNDIFHKFIQMCLEYYREKRVINTLGGTSKNSSVSTEVTIGDTMKLLKNSFSKFFYGRNYYNVLNGLVFLIMSLDLLDKVKGHIGVPNALKTPEEYIPSLFEVLINKKIGNTGDVSRHIIHNNCAEYARDILIKLEAMADSIREGEIDVSKWLTAMENKIEGYRAAYRTLTGQDLGLPTPGGIPKIDQVY